MDSHDIRLQNLVENAYRNLRKEEMLSYLSGVDFIEVLNSRRALAHKELDGEGLRMIVIILDAYEEEYKARTK